jgi:uncharacterized protein (DUF58 family)
MEKVSFQSLTITTYIYYLTMDGFGMASKRARQERVTKTLFIPDLNNVRREPKKKINLKKFR